MTTLERRLSDIVRLRTELESHDATSEFSSNCIDNNDLLSGRFVRLERIGSESANGEVFKACIGPPWNHVGNKLACNRDAKNVALKVMPYTKHLLKMKYPRTRWYETENETWWQGLDLNSITQTRNLEYSIWAELLVMRLCFQLVSKNVCPNLPLYMTYYKCDNCTYLSPNMKLNKANTKRCVIMVNELAGEGDLQQWALGKLHSLDAWLSAYFQIFTGLYALQKYFNVYHNDLHWGNVLVHKLSNKQGFIKYIIDGREYHVPHHGYLFTLWDFGYAFIPDKVANLETKKDREYMRRLPYLHQPYYQTHDVVDYSRFIYVHKDYIRKFQVTRIPKLENFLDMIIQEHEHSASIDQIISTFHGLYGAPVSGMTMEGVYSLDQKITLDPPSLAQFLLPEMQGDNSVHAIKTGRIKHLRYDKLINFFKDQGEKRQALAQRAEEEALRAHQAVLIAQAEVEKQVRQKAILRDERVKKRQEAYRLARIEEEERLTAQEAAQLARVEEEEERLAAQEARIERERLAADEAARLARIKVRRYAAEQTIKHDERIKKRKQVTDRLVRQQAEKLATEQAARLAQFQEQQRAAQKEAYRLELAKKEKMDIQQAIYDEKTRVRLLAEAQKRVEQETIRANKAAEFAQFLRQEQARIAEKARQVQQAQEALEQEENKENVAKKPRESSIRLVRPKTFKAILPRQRLDIPRNAKLPIGVLQPFQHAPPRLPISDRPLTLQVIDQQQRIVNLPSVPKWEPSPSVGTFEYDPTDMAFWGKLESLRI